jgi:hypothetical protein
VTTIGWVAVSVSVVVAVGLALVLAYALGAAVGSGRKQEAPVVMAESVGPPVMGISPEAALLIAALMSDLDEDGESGDEPEPAGEGPNLDFLDGK